MMWPQVDFSFGNIYIDFVFTNKKNQISKILTVRVFVPQKCQQYFEIL